MISSFMDFWRQALWRHRQNEASMMESTSRISKRWACHSICSYVELQQAWVWQTQDISSRIDELMSVNWMSRLEMLLGRSPTIWDQVYPGGWLWDKRIEPGLSSREETAGERAHFVLLRRKCSCFYLQRSSSIRWFLLGAALKDATRKDGSDKRILAHLLDTN